MGRLALDPGVLDTRLGLERPLDTPDGQGGVIRNWESVGSVWARLEAVSVQAVERAEQRGSIILHRVTMRHRPDVVIGMRLLHRDRGFAVRTLQDPDDTGRYLVCLCAEITP